MAKFITQGKDMLVIGEITLYIVGSVVIAEHNCVDIRHTPTILHVLRSCNTKSAGCTSLVVTTTSLS
jgi:putative NIF3 family GTP cyclohydrolase 1 type 2